MIYMKTYRIRYFECYERFYGVTANSKEEAEMKLDDDIREGREDGPDTCYASGTEVTEITV